VANDKWDIDRIYQFEDKGEWFTFVSPDGVGKVFYNSTEHARTETGIRSVVYLIGKPLDF